MATTKLTPYPFDADVWDNIRAELVREPWPDSFIKTIALKMCKGVYTSAAENPRIHDGTLMMARRSELTMLALLMDVCEDDAHYELFMRIARCIPGCLS